VSGHRHVSIAKDKDDSKASPLERVVRALNSGRLAFRENVATDIDWLTALGMACARDPGRSALVRLHYVADADSYEQALNLAVQIVRRVSMRQRWHMRQQEVIRVARISLAYHIAPVCPACHGTGFELIPGTAHLSSRRCPKCQGTGRRPYPINDGRRIREIVAHLESIERVTEDAVKRKMQRGGA